MYGTKLRPGEGGGGGCERGEGGYRAKGENEDGEESEEGDREWRGERVINGGRREKEKQNVLLEEKRKMRSLNGDFVKNAFVSAHFFTVGQD